MSNTLQFTSISHPHRFPKYRGGTDQGTRRMEDHTLASLNHHHQQHHQQHHQETIRTLSSITTKLTMPLNHRDKPTMIAVANANPESSNRATFTFGVSSSGSSSYSSEETGDVSSAPTTPVSESVTPNFAIDMKAVDLKIGEALVTPKASAVPNPIVVDVVDAEAGQETEDVWQDEDEHNVWGDYDSDETESEDDGSEWETESSGHEAEYDTDDDCGIEFGDSDDDDVEEDGDDDGLFGYDSEGDDVFGTEDEFEEGHLPDLPSVDSHRQSDRPPLRPCLSHAQTSQPMKRSESTGSRVRFSDTAEKPQVIQTRVFMYSYYEFDNMVRSNDCPNEVKCAFEDKRTEMEKFQELHALREFYISLLDPSEQLKERANPSNAIVGKMEHFLISKMMEKGGEDVLIEEPEKCTQFLMGLVGFGSLKLDEEEEKDNIIKRRNGTVPPTATPAETPDGSDGEWETDYEDDQETGTECDSQASKSKN